MKIDEAIKAMTDEVDNIPVIPCSKLHSAHLLGIEALKFYHELKRTQGVKIAFLLPGETEE